MSVGTEKRKDNSFELFATDADLNNYIFFLIRTRFGDDIVGGGEIAML